MTSEALFINGVFDSVLQEILQTQSELPEQILFLQPYSSRPMRKLRDRPPTTESPMWLFLSLSTDLAIIHYTAKIVGWDDKRTLSERKRCTVNRIIKALQPNEGGLYDASPTGDGKSVNLLHIRQLRRFEPPFPVGCLIKTSDGEPLSSGRTTAGGWAYVKRKAV
jgi:5-methylcytosine-specific restriction protein A